MDGVVKEIVEKERMIVEEATLTKQVEQEHDNNAITLFDVFKVVDRTRFPVLWDIVLRVRLTPQPQSVANKVFQFSSGDYTKT